MESRKPLRVTMQPISQQPNQIVDAPIAGVEIEPKQSTLLGRRNQSVEKEMISRNLGEARNQQAKSSNQTKSFQKNPARDKPAPKPEQTTQHERGQQLLPFLPDPFAPQSSSSQQSQQANAINRSFGDVTLLNTKSYPFSEYLIERGYRAMRLLTINAELTTWYYGQLDQLQLPAAVAVTVNAKGDILLTTTVKASGVAQLDHLLANALRGALQGVVPPEKALDDGELTVMLVLDHEVLSIGIR